ncbi:hypothetical protein B0A49_01089 [Cryomyces minteri]|uniref:Ataxin-10 homolog n=1 Tax=Cryomyces minteri TaxID=331657 RepID=A0A4U0XVH1_9PEZI|nr:hypothetical protein B0A49_01089 [Cryomyces minteri]
MATSTLEMLDSQAHNEILKATAQKDKPEVRQGVGLDPQVWKDLVECFRAAIPSLERRSFAAIDAASPDYENASGTLIASNYPGLYKDLERLDDLLAITRNVLTVGDKVQDLAAEHLFDVEVFRLISVCVKVTARGYDGDAGSQDEINWQWIINAYKKVLIKCLQFMNNLVAKNERRKLMLWVGLFDSSSDSPSDDIYLNAGSGSPTEPNSWNFDRDSDVPIINATRALLNASGQFQSTASREDPLAFNDDGPTLREAPKRPLTPYFLFIKHVRAVVRKELGENAGAQKVAEECAIRWTRMPDEDKELWKEHYERLHAQYRNDMALYNAIAKRSGSDNEDEKSGKFDPDILPTKEDKTDHRVGSSAQAWYLPDSFLDTESKGRSPMPLESLYDIPGPRPVEPADFRVTFSDEVGARTLQQGKDDLMKRLENYPAPAQTTKVTSPSSPVVSPASPVYDGDRADQTDDGMQDESEEEDSEDDDDYIVPGEDARGLLTDVPLILGPNEIEVLPMVIMSGIVPPPNDRVQGATADETTSIHQMHTVRCHLLLAQDNGRNLLRELLIFVAAWDLREDELYFKFMVKIMEAILVNGLMPFTYHAFRDKSRSKDIISPAQAVIMKLLTNIFRARQTSKAPLALAQAAVLPDGTSTPLIYPLRADVHIVNYLFTEFRQHIIPQTCALIFLQGKIHRNAASPEDFPLNLWDMERMYEGVYQYLEFFAILTEHDVWKQMMADWEITSELVTLLLELDSAIPKLTAATMQRRAAPEQRTPVQTGPPQGPPPSTLPPTPAPVAVERPFDLDAPDTVPASASPANPIFESETPLAYPEDPQDEPSEFEWRNLKKLTVLVLSSLIWHSRKVQDQVRAHGGITAILSCCTHDEHNPYIREHAIMCLRFLLEGNTANQDFIRQLDPLAVPTEVLDQNGYETFMDGKGQVGLRRKEGVAAPATATATSRPAQPKTTARLPAERAAEWMQHAMKDLPVRDERLGAAIDAAKKEALAKLDRSFEGSK